MNLRTIIKNHELNKLRKEIAEFSCAFDNLADHVVITNRRGIILYANRAAERATGYTAAEMIGKTPGSLWGGLMPPSTYRDMWHTINVMKKSWHGRIKNHTRNGDQYLVWSRINPVLDSANNCRFFVAIEPRLDLEKLSEEQMQEEIAAKMELYDLYVGKPLAASELSKIAHTVIAQQAR